MSAAIETQLREIIATLGEFSPDFDSKAHIFHQLGLESANALQLLLKIEETFSVAVPDEDFNEVNNLDQLVQLVSRLTQAAA